jgi:hypothetical protein
VPGVTGLEPMNLTEHNTNKMKQNIDGTKANSALTPLLSVRPYYEQDGITIYNGTIHHNRC